MPTLTLSGCAPVPLAHYLKALGILRLVSEQKDPNATGRWHRDQFILTSTLDREALLKFFYPMGKSHFVLRFPAWKWCSKAFSKRLNERVLIAHGLNFRFFPIPIILFVYFIE